MTQNDWNDLGTPVSPGQTLPPAQGFSPEEPFRAELSFNLDNKPQEPTDDWNDLGELVEEPMTAADRIRPVRQGAATGLFQGLGAIGGGALGFKAGGMIAGPPGALAGTLAGVYLGSEGPGMMATRAFGLPREEDIPARERPWWYVGQTLGGSASAVTSLYSLIGTNIRLAGHGAGLFINQVMNFARTQPKTFIGLESFSAVLAGTAAGVTESVAPGETGKRITAEIIGGAYGPQVAISVAKRGFMELERVWSAMSPSGAESGAVRMIRDVFQQTGGDIEAVARVYREMGLIPNDQLTPAQRTGSPELAAIEEYVSSVYRNFGAKVDKRFEAALNVVRTNISMLSQTGDPTDLETAARLQREFFSGLTQARAQHAATYAQQQMLRITKTGADIDVESKQINEIVQNAISTSRAEESKLWKLWLDIDGNQPALAKNLDETYRFHEEALGTWRDRLPAEVRKYLSQLEGPVTQELQFDDRTGVMALKDVTASDKPTTTRELWNQRSQILREMRAAQTGDSPDHQLAAMLNDLAEAISRDLEGSATAAGRVAYNEARAFTSEFYDVYQRSFVGRTQGKGSYGAKMAPELIAERVFAGSDTAVTIKLNDLEQATRFVERRGLGGETAVQDMLDGQERLMRIMMSDVTITDPGTGVAKVDVVKLQKRLVDHKKLLDRFPEVKADLQAALTSEVKARDLIRVGKAQEQTMASKEFSRILKKEPVDEAIAVLKSSDMPRKLQQYLNVTKPVKSRSGAWIVSPERSALAKEGAASAVFEAAIRMSIDREGVLNPKVFRSLTQKSPIPGQKSAIDIMLENGVIDKNHVKNIERLFNEFDAILSTTRFQGTVDVQPDLTSVAGATIARGLGAQTAGSMARAAGSNTPALTIHGAGARFFEYVYTKLGRTTATKFLSEAMLDPQKMELLLTKASKLTPAQAAEVNRRLHAALVQSGMGMIEHYGGEAEEEIMRPYTRPPAAPELFTQPEVPQIFTQPR